MFRSTKIFTKPFPKKEKVSQPHLYQMIEVGWKRLNKTVILGFLDLELSKSSKVQLCPAILLGWWCVGAFTELLNQTCSLTALSFPWSGIHVSLFTNSKQGIVERWIRREDLFSKNVQNLFPRLHDLYLELHLWHCCVSYTQKYLEKAMETLKLDVYIDVKIPGVHKGMFLHTQFSWSTEHLL